MAAPEMIQLLWEPQFYNSVLRTNKNAAEIGGVFSLSSVVQAKPALRFRCCGGGTSCFGSIRERVEGPERSCVRPVRLFQAMATAGTIVTVEYVPASTP